MGLRPEHRLAAQPAVALTDLAHDVLGTTPADLFPGWALSQRQALEQAGISPPTIDLADTDLTATRWAEQQGIDWMLLIPSLAAAHTTTVIRPTSPAQLVPFTLQWNPQTARTPWPSPGSCTPHSPPSCRQAGTRSRIICAITGERFRGNARSAECRTHFVKSNT